MPEVPVSGRRLSGPPTTRVLHSAQKRRYGWQSAAACVDLFCGAGGLTHGLLAAGIPVLAGVDVDPECRFPYEANSAGAVFVQRDIATVTRGDLQAWFGDAAVRILAGCAPCQPFSTYTHGYRMKGTLRWGLLYQFTRLIDEARPEVVTMENVPSIRRHHVFTDFVAFLTSHGYNVWHDVVDCADYGLPQRRRRMVLIASLIASISLPRAGGAPTATVRDAIEHLPTLQHGEQGINDHLHTASRLSPVNLRRIQASRPGGTWRDWPSDLIADCHRKPSGMGYASVYGRMAWDKPSPTITTQFYGFGNGRFGHPEQHRALSLREGALLQGFPDRYRFLPADATPKFTSMGRLIGNAVPFPLARQVGHSIAAQIYR